MAIRRRQLADGSVAYLGRYRAADGRERTKQFSRKADAKQWLAAQETARTVGSWVDPRLGQLPFSELVDRWRQASAHLKPKTVAGYTSILDKHLLPRFATRRVSSFSKSDVRQLTAEMKVEGAGPGTIRNTVNLLSGVLRVAVEDGLLATNPCDNVKLPRPERAEMHFLDPGQVERLAEAIQPPYGTLVRFAAYTGLRAGEIAALRVGRVDLLRGSVDVRRAFSEVHGRLVEGETKTYSRRSVALPPFLVDQLTVHMAGISQQADALVFTSPDGSPLRQSNFYRRTFKPAVRAAGLPDGLRFHDLRHTCAALLIAEGAHPRALMERLGHSSVTTSLDRYGHLFPSLDESLTTGLEEIRRRAVAEISRTFRGPEVIDLYAARSRNTH